MNKNPTHRSTQQGGRSHAPALDFGYMSYGLPWLTRVFWYETSLSLARLAAIWAAIAFVIYHYTHTAGQGRAAAWQLCEVFSSNNLRPALLGAGILLGLGVSAHPGRLWTACMFCVLTTAWIQHFGLLIAAAGGNSP